MLVCGKSYKFQIILTGLIIYWSFLLEYFVPNILRFYDNYKFTYDENSYVMISLVFILISLWCLKRWDRFVVPMSLASICLINAYYKFYNRLSPNSEDYVYQSNEEVLLAILFCFSDTASYFYLINIGLIFAFWMT